MRTDLDRGKLEEFLELDVNLRQIRPDQWSWFADTTSGETLSINLEQDGSRGSATNPWFGADLNPATGRFSGIMLFPNHPDRVFESECFQGGAVDELFHAIREKLSNT